MDLLLPTHISPALRVGVAGRKQGRTVVSQLLLHSYIAGAITVGEVNSNLLHVLLLSLSSHLQLLLVRFLLVNRRNELIQFRITHTLVDFAGVEVLNAISRISTDTPTGEGTIVLLRAHHRVELRLRLAVLLKLNTCRLELLLKVLELSQGGCI